MDDGTDFYYVTGASRPGRKLDGPAAFRMAMAAALRAEPADRTIALPVADVRPAVTEADVAALVPERWIDVDLTRQRAYAVVGKKVVYTAVVSTGKKDWETPTGTFYINRRVANETMTSASIGAEEYYRLENVLPDTVRRALWPQLGMHAPTLARPRPHHQIVQDLLRSGDTAGFGRDALKRILPRR